MWQTKRKPNALQNIAKLTVCHLSLYQENVINKHYITYFVADKNIYMVQLGGDLVEVPDVTTWLVRKEREFYFIKS